MNWLIFEIPRGIFTIGVASFAGSCLIILWLWNQYDRSYLNCYSCSSSYRLGCKGIKFDRIGYYFMQNLGLDNCSIQIAPFVSNIQHHLDLLIPNHNTFPLTRKPYSTPHVWIEYRFILTKRKTTPQMIYETGTSSSLQNVSWSRNVVRKLFFVPS